MPRLIVIPDLTERPFSATRELAMRFPGRSGEQLRDAGQIVHLGEDGHVEVGALPEGMTSGEPAIAFCFRLPDRRVAIIETSLRLFLSAADGMKARWGDPRMADMSMPDITLPPDFPPLAMVRAARVMAAQARDSVSGPAFDQLGEITAALERVETADGMPPAPEPAT